MNEKGRARVCQVLVVDDHPIVREGIALLIAQQQDMTVCGEAADIAGAMRLVPMLHPDVVVVDISLGAQSGLELIGALRTHHPKIAILALSMYDEILYAERALRSGANGYIMKQEGTALLLTAIREVFRGKVYVSPAVNTRLIESVTRRGVDPDEQSPLSRLSDREMEVFRLIGMGIGTREIARGLHVSVKTIETHRAKIKEKLGYATATELVIHAAQWAFQGASGRRSPE